MADPKIVDADGLKKIIQSVVTQMKTELAGKVSSIKVSNTDDINVDSTDPSNPIIALSPVLLNKINTMWDIVSNGIKKEDTPAPVIDYIAEKLANLSPNASYAVNGVQTYANNNGEIPFYQSWFGTTINIIKKSTAVNREDSLNDPLPIPSRPATPVIMGSKSKITGVDTTMEYRLSGSDTWYNVTSDSISNLQDGSYEVRVKATQSSFASLAATTTVTSGYVAVLDITGVPTTIEQSVWNRLMDVNLNNTIIVSPNNATYQSIIWTIADSGTTQPTLSLNGSRLRAYGTGTMVIQARIFSGSSPSTDYFKYFTIQVVPPYTLSNK